MDLKNLVETLVAERGADTKITTNHGPMTLAELMKQEFYTDGRFGSLQCGIDEDGYARIKLEKAASGPIFRIAM